MSSRTGCVSVCRLCSSSPEVPRARLGADCGPWLCAPQARLFPAESGSDMSSGALAARWIREAVLPQYSEARFFGVDMEEWYNAPEVALYIRVGGACCAQCCV
jgi:hypothetical protein